MYSPPRPVTRIALYGALLGSLFVIATPAAGSGQQVMLISAAWGRVPLGALLGATLIPVLMCTVWAVAMATRWWPLAGIVGLTLGRLLIGPLLGLLGCHPDPGVNVQEAAGLTLAAVSMVAAGFTLPPRVRTP